MKTILTLLIGAFTLGTVLPAMAGPDWQIIEHARKAKLERLQQHAALSQTSADSSGDGMSKGNTMSGMSMDKCMDMKGMTAQDCNAMMKGMDHQKMPMAAAYHAVGVVKAADPAKGTVTIAHGPVADLHWPAMTMTFMVKDKGLFDKLAVDKKVDVGFTQQDRDYVVTSVQ